VKSWLPLLLLALTACAPTVHVVEDNKPTFADVDVCTLLKDRDVEAQKLTKTTSTGKRSCEFAFGEGTGAVSVEVTLLAERYDSAKKPLCEGFDGCDPTAQYTKFHGRSIIHKCVDASGTMTCKSFAQAGEEKTVNLVVRRSPDSVDALGRLTDDIAHKLLIQRVVTS
jgi:hypothetical protein